MSNLLAGTGRALIVGALVTGLSLPGGAQDSAAERPDGIESITVTAQKREESLQDAPLAVSAFAAGDLERYNFDDLESLENFSPGLSMNLNNEGSGTTIFMRGVGTGDFTFALQGRVGVYIDGVYVGAQMGNTFDLIDIERLEVLRGPQGTLFGRNTIGGALNIITAKPEPEFGGKVHFELGSHEHAEAHVTLNVPISERLLTRLSFSRTSRGEYHENDAPGRSRDFESPDSVAARIAARFLASDSVTADYTFQWIERDSYGRASWLNSESVGQAAVLGVVFPADELGRNGDDDSADADWPTFARQRDWSHNLTFAWDVSENLTLKSISGWRKIRTSLQSDLDGSSLFLFTKDEHNKQVQFFQEINAVGTAMEGDLDYAVGGTWFNQHIKLHAFNNSPFGFFRQIRTYDGDDYAWGAYGEATYHVTERLSLTGGLRYDKERKETTRGNGLTAGCGLAACVPFFPSDIRFDGWTVKARAAFHWTDSLMTYLTWSRGYQSGGYNDRIAAAVADASFDDETLFSWEAGMKSRWFDDRLQLNVAGFYNTFEDQQVASFINGVNLRFNAGESRLRGFEVELRARPIRALDIAVNHAWISADFIEYIRDVGGIPTNVASDRIFAFTPKRTWSANVQYSFDPMSIGQLVISGGFSRVGAQSNQGTKSDVTALDAVGLIGANHYTIYNARIQLNELLGREGLWIALVGENLGDRVYRTGGVNFQVWNWNQYGDPRTFRVEGGLKF